jgi:hypothetical protein
MIDGGRTLSTTARPCPNPAGTEQGSEWLSKVSLADRMEEGRNLCRARCIYYGKKTIVYLEESAHTSHEHTTDMLFDLGHESWLCLLFGF